MRALRETPEEVVAGLSDAEIASTEGRFGFGFNPDHREFLQLGLPLGERWPNWRSPGPWEARRVAWPVETVLDDVPRFWFAAWGPRPDRPEDAKAVARSALREAPVLAPLYSHRFLPAAPAGSGMPVFSVWGSDVTHYGADLADYIVREHDEDRDPVAGGLPRVPFWTDLVEANGY